MTISWLRKNKLEKKNKVNAQHIVFTPPLHYPANMIPFFIMWNTGWYFADSSFLVAVIFAVRFPQFKNTQYKNSLIEQATRLSSDNFFNTFFFLTNNTTIIYWRMTHPHKNIPMRQDSKELKNQHLLNQWFSFPPSPPTSAIL